MSRDETVGLRWLFTPPAPPDGLALRRDVVERLSAPSVHGGLVIAPAGYGKTSHAAFIVNRDARPVAWLDIEPQHDDASVLLTALMAALSTVTDIDGSDIGAGGGGPDLYTIGLATAFGRALRRCSEPFVVVLDDIHLLSETSASDLINSLISNVPAGSMVLLVGRACRLDALHRLRVEPGIAEIRSGDLTLGPAEVEDVLVGMGVDASAEQVGKVIADTEGWPVGVRLAGLSRIADADEDHQGARVISGRDASVSHYIRTEWLWGLGDDEYDFLRRVSVLDWLSGPLCNKVTGRNDAGEVLHRIHDNRLLVIPLDRRASAYRMHPLLREALISDLERHDEAALREVHVLRPPGSSPPATSTERFATPRPRTTSIGSSD